VRHVPAWFRARAPQPSAYLVWPFASSISEDNGQPVAPGGEPEPAVRGQAVWIPVSLVAHQGGWTARVWLFRFPAQNPALEPVLGAVLVCAAFGSRF